MALYELGNEVALIHALTVTDVIVGVVIPVINSELADANEPAPSIFPDVAVTGVPLFVPLVPDTESLRLSVVPSAM